MKLIVGLGNPWSKYKANRHNIWATMLERFLEWEQLGQIKYDAKFAAEVLIISPTLGESWRKKEGVVFATPQTFMNASGNAVESIARFYKIETKNILVLHDEIEFPLGKIAIKHWGWAAGHNGLRSITTKLWDSEYDRLRIGVGKSENIWVATYVLQDFKSNENEILTEKENEIFQLIKEFLEQ